MYDKLDHVLYAVGVTFVVALGLIAVAFVLARMCGGVLWHLFAELFNEWRRR